MKISKKVLLAAFIFIFSTITSAFLSPDNAFAIDHGAACDTQYSNSTTSMRNACKLGGDHVGEADFCATQFPEANSLAREACDFGRKTAQGLDTTPQAKPNEGLNFTTAAAWCDTEYADDTTSIREACKAATTSEHIGDNNYCSTVGEVGSLAFEACKAGQAKAREVNTNADGTPAWETTTGTSNVDSDKTCVIPYIGWAICPILLAASAGIDQSYEVVRSFLETPISIFTDARVQEVYGHILAYANVLLGVIFLIIIYAELTGGLMSNYTIKKLLPKLIISAIIINIAFYICAAIVDLVNIVGAGIPEIFTTLSPSTNPALGGVAGGITSATSTGPEFEAITRGVLSGGGIAAGVGVAAVTITGTTWSAMLWAVVLFLIPIILGILVAILAILLALTLRSVAIVIFVIISPLAFCAMILPNTQKWFQKWWDIFFKMLLLYPIVALVFAGSALAGDIIINTAGAQSNEIVKVIMLIAGSAATILPLVVVPGLLKGAAVALGTLGAKVSGFADKGYNAARSTTDKRMRESSAGKHFESRENLRKTMRRSGISRGDTRKALRTTSWAQSRSMAGASAIADLDATNLRGMESYLDDYLNEDDQQLTAGEYVDIVTGQKTHVGKIKSNDYMKIAALNKLSKAAGGGEIAQLTAYFGHIKGHAESQSVRNAAFETFRAKGSRATQVRAGHIPKVMDGTFNNETAIKQLIEGGLAPETLANVDLFDPEMVRQMRDYTLNVATGAEQGRLFRHMRDNINRVYSDDQLSRKLNAQQKEIFDSVLRGDNYDNYSEVAVGGAPKPSGYFSNVKTNEWKWVR